MNRAFPIFVAVIAGVTATPAVARRGDPFCTDLSRIVAAAAESPPFGSLLAGDAEARFAFFLDCRKYAPGPAEPLSCSWEAPSDEIREEMAFRTTLCIPAAVRTDDRALLIGGGPEFRIGEVRVEMGHMVLAGGRQSRDFYLNVTPTLHATDEPR